MMHFIAALIAGIVGLFAALLGIGLGLGALLMVAAPFLLLLLIPLLPVLVLVWILRRIGILSGPFLTFVVLVAGFFLVIGGIHTLWNRKSDSLGDWIEAKKDQLETCREQGGDTVGVQWDGDDLVFTCRGKHDSPSPKPGDAHI